MQVLVWIHLVGASLWLGGLVMLAAAVLVARRTLPRDDFRRFVRATGRTFAGISLVAWLLIGVSGILMADQLGWPQLAVRKAILAGFVVAGTVAHSLTGMHTNSRVLVAISRLLALLILIGTLVLFWQGVRLAG